MGFTGGYRNSKTELIFGRLHIFFLEREFIKKILSYSQVSSTSKAQLLLIQKKCW